MTIIGTRPEIIRLSACIKAADQYFNHILVHTGQNWDYTLNKVFFQELGIREPNYYLDCAGRVSDTQNVEKKLSAGSAQDTNLGHVMGTIIAKSYDVMLKENPDALLILGDTNSALAAISAKRLKIPIFHMEAGNRCFDFNVPEEINRRIVDHISDVNLPYTEHSRRYLLDEGIRKEHIFVTGSPMSEVLNANRDAIENSKILENLSLEENCYILVSAHREENLDNEDNFISLMEAINEVARTYEMPVIYSTHPRSRKLIEKRGFQFHPLVKNMKPFGFFDYNKLQMSAYCVLSDSGTLSEESAILEFSGVLIRTSTERPEVLDKGTVIIGGIHGKDVEQAIELAVEMKVSNHNGSMAPDYADENVSTKVIKIIQSYTKIINKNTWDKR